MFRRFFLSLFGWWWGLGCWVKILTMVFSYLLCTLLGVVLNRYAVEIYYLLTYWGEGR